MRIAFISGMSGVPWGGSEILWSRTALWLKQQGHEVFASVAGWPETPKEIQNLKNAGIEIQERLLPNRNRFLKSAGKLFFKVISCWNSLGFILSKSRIRKFAPDIVCVSNGGIACGLKWMEWCRDTDIPYISVIQANAEFFWPADHDANRLMSASSAAKNCYFVSHANLTLFESQIGASLPNAKVIWNPFQLLNSQPPRWPSQEKEVRMACVGRLDPAAKGQDLILRMLSMPKWKGRDISVSFFGAGPMEQSLKRLAKSLGVTDQVKFCGHTAVVDQIWADHHALLLPSRYEGLPLAVVEAMLSARPVVVTDIAGNTEIVDDNVNGFIASAPTVAFLDEAMERFWQCREGLEHVGALGFDKIKQLLPSDPIKEFADLILDGEKSNLA